MQSHGEKLRYLFYIQDDYLKRCQQNDFVMHGYCIMSNHVHETGRTGEDLTVFSNHMRRAHGRFGQSYNKRHNRLGKVAHDRPKTKRIENDEALMRCMLYSDCNPVRAGLIKHPTDVRWRGLSSCRYYAYGEENEHTKMLTPPEWYTRLGKHRAQRQHMYRSMLEKYLEESGLKRDSRMSRGHFLGGSLWMEEMRAELRSLIRMMRTGPPG